MSRAVLHSEWNYYENYPFIINSGIGYLCMGGVEAYVLMWTSSRGMSQQGPPQSTSQLAKSLIYPHICSSNAKRNFSFCPVYPLVLFLSQGIFFECRASPMGIKHYYHKLCGVLSPSTGAMVCPHCGSSEPPSEVHLEIRLPRKPIVYLEQRPEKKSR